MNSSVKNILSAIFVLCIFCESSESYNLNHNIPANPDSSRTPSVQSCMHDVSKFQCNTTIDCINPELKCDGKEDCPDGSDEKLSLCKDFPCTGTAFRCDYGACIDMDAICDGKKDCTDNSDELNCEITDKMDINCRSDQYECANGQCIDMDRKCNGAADCKDKSDETEDLCFNSMCPEHSFKCKYGACVDGGAECNNVQNCIDNSDEDEKKCSRATPDVPETDKCSSNQCTFPARPDNGNVIVISTGKKCHNNSLMEVNSVVKYTCDSGYKLSTTDESSLSVQCLPTGEWSVTVLPTCQKLCPSFYNTDLIIYKCKNKDSSVPCDKSTDNTILTYECAPYYEPPHGTSRSSTCYDGLWDNFPKCVPVCGEKIVSATPLIVNGHEVQRGHYPWVVALYRKQYTASPFINICSGTLITTQIVLTAAHCVTFEESYKMYDAKRFRVGAGKYYNNYKDPRDTDTVQYSEIAQIEIHDEYKGDIQNYRADIALLKLKTNLVLSKVVQPVCFKELPPIQPNAFGVIAGWGYTISSGKPSETLKELELPYIGHEECSKNFDTDFSTRYVTSDKLCAGYNNQNSSVCKGDSGGGLAVINPNIQRYFIYGIVSLNHPYKENETVHCNIQRSAILTKVDTYIDWIKLVVRHWNHDGSATTWPYYGIKQEATVLIPTEAGYLIAFILSFFALAFIYCVFQGVKGSCDLKCSIQWGQDPLEKTQELSPSPSPPPLDTPVWTITQMNINQELSPSSSPPPLDAPPWIHLMDFR